MSANQLEQIKRQITALTAEERAELRRYLATTKTATDRSPSAETAAEAKDSVYRRRQAWIKAHWHEVGGRYIVLDGEQLLGTGTSYPEALAIARRAGVNNAYIDYVPTPDETGQLSGWE